MNRRTATHKLALIAVLITLTLASTLALPAPVGADETATLTVTAANAAVLSITVEEDKVNFGSNLTPSGDKSDSKEIVVAFTDTPGAYYVWKCNDGLGNFVTVRSSRSWSGTISATETSGSSTSMTIASGVLRYATTAAASYAEAAAMTALSTAPQTWMAAGPAGANTYTHFYSLRVSWADTVGTFASVVTYAVSII